jgi:excisionase family DNA binding protein
LRITSTTVARQMTAAPRRSPGSAKLNTSNPASRLRRMLSIREAAEFFLVSDKTVRRWIASGELHAHKLGRQWRLAPEEIERFLATRAIWQRRYVS